MEFLDFTEFKPFNQPRKKTGAEAFGFFELFDPAIHLTGSERFELENIGLLKKPIDIRALPDKTLAIKNSRVPAYIPDEAWYRTHREYPAYHLALCSQLESLIIGHPAQELLVTSKIAEDYKLLKVRSSGEVAMTAWPGSLQAIACCGSLEAP